MRTRERIGNWLQQLLAKLPREGAERLERSLDRTSAGFEEDLRTPFANQAPREEVIGELEVAIGPSEFPELEAIDEHEKEKIGPFSIMLPYQDRIPDVMKYYKAAQFAPDESCFSTAVGLVASILPARSLRPATFSAAESLTPKDTSKGLPWVTRSKDVEQDYLDRAISLRVPGDVYPCILYWRGQAKGLNEIPKQRVVWGFDHAETICGATILYPLLEALKARPGFSAWLGDVFVDEAITSLLRSAGGRRIISMDYSNFDSSVGERLSRSVDAVLQHWFVEEVHERIALLGEVSLTVPLVVPYEVLGGRMNGVPSGSVLTNVRDTLANLIAGYYVALRARVRLIDYEVLGDDSVFLFDRDVDPEDVSAFISEIGLESNPEKQFVSTNSVHYLQRWHSLDYAPQGVSRGVRSPYRALSGMLSYERFRNDWNKYMDTSRWIMQVENVKHDPRFTSFVKFLRGNDEVLRSGMDPSTVFRLAGGSDRIRSTLGIASFPFNIQNPENVNVFETTQILRSLG